MLSKTKIILNQNLIIKSKSSLNKIITRAYSYANEHDLISAYQRNVLVADAQNIAKNTEDVVFATTGAFSINNIYGSFSSRFDVVSTNFINVNNIPWNSSYLSVESLINNSPRLISKLNHQLVTDIHTGCFSSKNFADQKLNTVQEVACVNIVPKYIPFRSLEFNKLNYNIPYSYFNLTGQHRPDYIGCIVSSYGQQYIFYIDLKRTTIWDFEQTILGLNAKKAIYCNIHLVGDAQQNYVFDPRVKFELEKSFKNVYNINIQSGDPIARLVANESLLKFSYFRARGDIESYNQIPLNTPKFITLQMLHDSYPTII